jgi:hypothetical protein
MTSIYGNVPLHTVFRYILTNPTSTVRMNLIVLMRLLKYRIILEADKTVTEAIGMICFRATDFDHGVQMLNCEAQGGDRDQYLIQSPCANLGEGIPQHLQNWGFDSDSMILAVLRETKVGSTKKTNGVTNRKVEPDWPEMVDGRTGGAGKISPTPPNILRWRRYRLWPFPFESVA